MHKEASDILKSLHGFISGPDEDVSNLPSDQVQAYLKSEGIDPVPMVHNVRQRIARLKAEKALAEAREKRMGFISKMASVIGEVSQPSLKDKIRETIEKLTQGSPELATVYFRKFEETKEEDLESLLEDLNLLEEMDGEDVAHRSR